MNNRRPNLRRLAVLIALLLAAAAGGCGQTGSPANVVSAGETSQPVTGRFVDDPAALWVTPAGGPLSGDCSRARPCAMTRALAEVRAGGVIIANPGTYSGDVNIANVPNHVGITITAPAAVKNQLTFTCDSPFVVARARVGGTEDPENCGRVSGADNRPLWGGDTFTIAAANVTLDHLRIRFAPSPASGFGSDAVAVRAPGATITNCELWNGTAVAMYATGPLTVRWTHMHDSGLADGDEPDTHTFFSCRNVGCGGSGETATNWTQAIRLCQSTFSGTGDSDQIQLATGDDGSGRDSYIEICYNDFAGTIDEQMFDSKGSDQVMIHGNDMRSANVIQATSTPIDFVASDMSSRFFWIWDNWIRPSTPTYGCILFGHGPDDADFAVWNNIFDGCGRYEHPAGNDRAIGVWNGSPTRLTFVHNIVRNTSTTAGVIWGGISLERADTVVRNNIFLDVFQTSDDDGPMSTRRGNNATATHNGLDVSGCPSHQCSNGGNAVIQNINHFTDPAAGDFALVPASRFRNAGFARLTDDGFFTPSKDINGVTRDGSPNLGVAE